MAQTMTQTHGASGPMHSLQHHDGLSNGSNIPLYPNESPQQSEELYKRSVMIVIWYKVSSSWSSHIVLRFESETMRSSAAPLSYNNMKCFSAQSSRRRSVDVGRTLFHSAHPPIQIDVCDGCTSFADQHHYTLYACPTCPVPLRLETTGLRSHEPVTLSSDVALSREVQKRHVILRDNELFSLCDCRMSCPRYLVCCI